ncbi:LacI family DNA-binding transcriptional regulator [Xylanimonas protaetiae]|uniref:LacI family transcriptional regulator n=1 Tax=Xylanimonas protaetiae TaxID=2509457 RepID=A0A4P6F9P6_9MICO|nr:LacI family DNA-binding transcriptional regulator [Xylanimonas protaetiae]QAY71653.1 LacI family transcriptional regulator [Xylanimonas protaetiae]
MNNETGRAAKPRRATIKDVAQEAGVSRSTVSRALTGNGYVSADIRTRVLSAATRLRYVPDAMARSLRQQASSTIGVLVSDLRNSFYADMAAGAGLAARRAGYTMVLVDDFAAPSSEIEAVKQVVELRVAGVIIAPVSVEAVDYLLRNEVPVVEVDRQFASGRCDAVVVDNRAGARELTAHLVGLGHTRIALLVDQVDWTTGRDRLDGYRDALAQAGVAADENLVVSVGWTADAVHARVAELLREDAPPTALLAVNNVVAEGAYRAVMDAKLRLPQDISLVSFDDASWMSMVSPGVTAATQDAAALGDIAVGRLLNRIDTPDSPVQTVVLAARLVARGSTGKPTA